MLIHVYSTHLEEVWICSWCRHEVTHFGQSAHKCNWHCKPRTVSELIAAAMRRAETGGRP